VPDKFNSDATDDESASVVEPVCGNTNNWPPQNSYTVCTDTVPVTFERLPCFPKLNNQVEGAGTARVNVAATNYAPHGSQVRMIGLRGINI
jgi:hypothetical protein